MKCAQEKCSDPTLRIVGTTKRSSQPLLLPMLSASVAFKLRSYHERCQLSVLSFSMTSCLAKRSGSVSSPGSEIYAVVSGSPAAEQFRADRGRSGGAVWPGGWPPPSADWTGTCRPTSQGKEGRQDDRTQQSSSCHLSVNRFT